MTATLSRTPLHRVEGPEKVTGAARYAVDYPVDHPAYAWPVLAHVASGRVTDVDVASAEAVPGVLRVFWHANAPSLATTEPMLRVLQDPEIHYWGEVVALVVATSAETAREVADRLPVTVVERDHQVVLAPDDPELYEPERVNAGIAGRSSVGDADAAFDASPVQLDQTYRTPALHNNPMEPHSTTAVFADGRLTLYDSTQGGYPVQSALAKAFGLPPDRVQVISAHVGGGFGSKGTPRPNVVLAALAAREVGRPVRLALTRQQLFSLVGYRTPTIQRLRLGADRDGRLRSISHQATVQTARHAEFVEQVTVAARMMYAAPNRLTLHRAARLDVPIPSWMRAPGECPGMFALESAMDELAQLCGIDPIELRIRNEPDVDPERRIPYSSRNLVGCLRGGAEMFGWSERPARPRSRRDGKWWVGMGVAASTYPAYAAPATATVTAGLTGRFVVEINATDIGTGARTALLVLAAEALGVSPDRVEMRIGSTDLPRAGVAGGSMGTTSWGWAVTKACAELLDRVGGVTGLDTLAAPLSVTADTRAELKAQQPLSRHAFGAQFVEARVHADTGEVRVPRMLGVFAAGRIVNPRTARSQFLGGMTMGLGMALLEQGVLDVTFGDYSNHDLADYHVAVNPDVPSIRVQTLPEDDPAVNPLGTKGIGEIGIVGTAAAVANAVYSAVGVRVRSLPIRVEDVIGAL